MEHAYYRCGRESGKANVMASLYDASLDKLYQHDWRFNLWFSRPVPWIYAGMLSANQGIGMFAGFPYVRTYTGLNLLNGEYSSLLVFPEMFICEASIWLVHQPVFWRNTMPEMP